MREQNCLFEEFEDEDDNDGSNAIDASGLLHVQKITMCEPPGPPQLPMIEITKSSANYFLTVPEPAAISRPHHRRASESEPGPIITTRPLNKRSAGSEPTPPVLEAVAPLQIPTDLHQAQAQVHRAQHPLRHLLHRHRPKPPPRPHCSPKEFLERAYVRGKIHDCLCFNNGIGHVGVIGWRLMEYLPFRRMDLQPDGSWKAIVWPLPRGEVRDIPNNARIHCSVLKRMKADPR
jgi:hypothetical protein